MTITELKNEFVFANLGNGNRVVACEFDTLRMMDCADLKVSAIQLFMAKPTVKFFTVSDEQA